MLATAKLILSEPALELQLQKCLKNCVFQYSACAAQEDQWFLRVVHVAQEKLAGFFVRPARQLP